MFNRRRGAGAGPAPSLKTLIRQLHMTALSHADDAALARFRPRLSAAANLAASNQEVLCAAELAALSARIEAARDVRALSGDAADTLARAMAVLS